MNGVNKSARRDLQRQGRSYEISLFTFIRIHGEKKTRSTNAKKHARNERRQSGLPVGQMNASEFAATILTESLYHFPVSVFSERSRHITHHLYIDVNELYYYLSSGIAQRLHHSTQHHYQQQQQQQREHITTSRFRAPSSNALRDRSVVDEANKTADSFTSIFLFIGIPVDVMIEPSSHEAEPFG